MIITADEQRKLLDMGIESRRLGIPSSENPFFKKPPTTDAEFDIWIERVRAWGQGWIFEDLEQTSAGHETLRITPHTAS